MRGLLRTLVVLLVLLVLLAALDAGAARYAENRASQAIQSAAGTSSAPTVDIAGTPFLTQALRGRFDAVTVVLDDPTQDEQALQVDRVTVELTGIRFPVSAALRGRVEEATADQVHALGRVRYAALAQQVARVGPAVVDLSYAYSGPGNVEVTGTVSTPVGALDVSGVAGVSIVDGRLRIVPLPDTLAKVPQAIRSQVVDLLTIGIGLQALPYDLTPSALTVTPEGLLFVAEGSDVMLTAP